MEKSNKLKLDFNIPDAVDVPKDTILFISLDDSCKDSPKKLVENLKGNFKRDWFTAKNIYYCLPVTMGSQHGFIVKAAYDFFVHWDGGNGTENVKVRHNATQEQSCGQIIASHFGMGTFSVVNPWLVRTPKGVNTLVMNPPNFYVDGIIHMSACVETDNLRREFTFNLRITRPNHWIEIKKDTPIGYLLPYPRYFIDNYDIKVDEEVLQPGVIENERTTTKLFNIERFEIDVNKPSGVGGRYMKGEDIYGNKFNEHQKVLKCPFKHS